MAIIYLAFIAAVVILGAILLSRNTLKRISRQRKTHAVLAMIRQPIEK